MDDKNGNNGWLQKVLERIEDHIQHVRRFMADSEKRWEQSQKRWKENERRREHDDRKWEQGQKRWEENERENERKWEHNEKRWWANHKILVHMLEEIRNLKRRP